MQTTQAARRSIPSRLHSWTTSSPKRVRPMSSWSRQPPQIELAAL